MGGGAWPSLVGGAICLVYSINERDLSLLTSCVEASLHGRLLKGTEAVWAKEIIAIVGLQCGIPSKRESSVRVDNVPALFRRLQRREKSTKPYHLEEGEVVTRFPLVNLRKDHYRTLETEQPENDETSLLAGFLMCLPIPWLCVHPCPRLHFWLDRMHSFRISPNPGTKSVKENATKQPAFANPKTVFVRKQCCNIKSKTTLGNGYLGSRIDEDRSKMRYLV
ncbi:LOW QUALITY PROTEIN: hypothetical protein YC2023_107938 [Brassica napus]